MNKCLVLVIYKNKKTCPTIITSNLENILSLILHSYTTPDHTLSFHNIFLIQSSFNFMTYIVEVEIPNSTNITLELDEDQSPETVKQFVTNLPFSLILNVWGNEIYTNESPIDMPEENAKSPVNLYDVAYWPTGKAICLFFGPTPIGKKDEITPASPVNVIGKIISPDKSVLNVAEGKKAVFRLKS